MSIAYSKKKIVSAQVRTSSPSIFFSDLNAILIQAGWRKIRELAGGGAVYQCFTPDGILSAKLQIENKGTGGFGGPYLVFTPMTANEHAHGQDYNIIWGNSGVPVYQVIVGICQLFLSIPTYANSPYSTDRSSCFAFGIPFLKDVPVGSSCAASGSSQVITDIWWANSDGSLPFFTYENFRNSPRAYYFNYSINGAVFTSQEHPDSSLGNLTLFYLVSTYNLDVPNPSTVPTVKYSTLEPINIDALIGWDFVVRGQVWDAFQRTRPEPLDAVQTYTDVDSQGGSIQLRFHVWMSSYYTSLLLLESTVSAGGGNVAY